MGIAVRSHEWCVERFARLEIIPQSAVKSTPADSFIEEYESGKGVNNADKKKNGCRIVFQCSIIADLT